MAVGNLQEEAGAKRPASGSFDQPHGPVTSTRRNFAAAAALFERTRSGEPDGGNLLGRVERIERYADANVEAAVARVEAVARLMDSAFEIPGTKVRMGLDALIGIVPVVGDLLSQIISSYIIWEARQLGVSRFTMARMIGNSLIDTVVGIIPFAGDAFDVMFRANMKNLALLKAHLAKNGHVLRSPHAGPVIDGTVVRETT